MAGLELTQLTLRISERPEILAHLRSAGSLKKDRYNHETLEVTFDGSPIVFQVGVPRNLDKGVAHSVIHDTRTVVGDPLTGEQVAIFDVLDKFDINTQQVQKSVTLPNTCEYCGDRFSEATKLGYHLMHPEDCPKHPQRGKKTASQVRKEIIAAALAKDDETPEETEVGNVDVASGSEAVPVATP